ncbi:hypothetical protein [Micromonospora tarapacensis]|uniref:hypothetical protein n=1 Tax=Micromonospora tarapacensis TaxID=2835305 RepID=UPI002F3E7AF8
MGASPAATAAWLGHRQHTDRAARAYLDDVVARHGGPVPCCTPITVFERSWTLATLTRVGLPVRPSPGLVTELAAALGPHGAATGPGCRPTPTPPRRRCTPWPGWVVRWTRRACSATTWAATSAPGGARTVTR